MDAIDYLDLDVAYLLGLIVARGEISFSEGGLNKIIIEFPFRNQKVKGITIKIDQKDQILLNLRHIFRRINELTSINFREEEGDSSISLILETPKNTMFLRNINFLLKGKKSYKEFSIPEEIFNAPSEFQKEFLRGFSDVAGSARAANAYISGQHRIYLDVLNQNWQLPIQLCYLLQDKLKIPVQTITYGHPNLRDPQLNDYNKGKVGWSREHQIKIFAENFNEIGFYVRHKQNVLDELANFNEDNFKHNEKYCEPPKSIRKIKPIHPEENSDKLPDVLKGQHCDTYWQICGLLGCSRYKNNIKASKKRKVSDKLKSVARRRRPKKKTK
ncbi:MAG: hypothetical protein HeimC3_53780 [Candidatus Heimdallarchaeota archaeon LC_3]|nr:MAG: hypothetical protein HeimC3_53780 [Candidatus Heimdallarchaeota archaeon LC_3]